MKKLVIIGLLVISILIICSISFTSAEVNETEANNETISFASNESNDTEVSNSNGVTNDTEANNETNETEIEYTNEELELPDAGITPDSALYGVDVFVDNARATLTPGALGKAIVRLDIVEERVAEMEVMAEKNKTTEAKRAQLEVQKQMKKFERSVEKVKKKDAPELNVYVQNYNARLEERKRRLISWGQPDYADAIAEAIKMFEEVENAIVNIPEDLDPESTFKLSLICEEAGATTPEECKEMIAGGLLVSVFRGVGEGEKRTLGPLDCSYGNINYSGMYSDGKTRWCCKDSDGLYSPEYIEHILSDYDEHVSNVLRASRHMLNYYHRNGTVAYKIINLETGEIEEGIERDSCDGNTLTEWICPTSMNPITRNERFFDEYDCPNGCEDGACINCNFDSICDENEDCSCSDCEGKNNGCRHSYFVCRNGECVEKEFEGECIESEDCPEEYDVCINGRCMKTEGKFIGECIDSNADSDGGKDYYVKGIVSAYEDDLTPYTVADTCRDDSWLEEFFCRDDNKVMMVRYLCPYGCQEGVCI